MLEIVRRLWALVQSSAAGAPATIALADEVRIIAPLELRLNMAQDRLKYSRAEALEYITRMDQDRLRWKRYLYGVDWGDPSLYEEAKAGTVRLHGAVGKYGRGGRDPAHRRRGGGRDRAGPGRTGRAGTRLRKGRAAPAGGPPRHTADPTRIFGFSAGRCRTSAPV